MFIILLSAEIAPDCFSLNSYLQGDIQSRFLHLVLLPQVPMDPLCTALNNSLGTAQLFFLNAAGFPDFISAEFTYLAGLSTVADVSIASLTMEQINSLIDIQVGDYLVKIQKSADIIGSLNSISYLKIDVSSCWSNQVYEYRPNFGEELFEFVLTPNDCVIPQDAVLCPHFTFRNNDSEIDLAEFQEGTEENEYKHPYIHNLVKVAKLRCQDINDEDKKKQCYEIIEFVTNSQDYYIGVKLTYETNGISTEVIQNANMYSAFESEDCATATNLTTYVYPDGFFIYHDKFVNEAKCQHSEKSINSSLTGVISGDDFRITYSQNYTIEEYRNIEYYNHNQDMEEAMTLQYSSYPQYIQCDKENQISGSFYFAAPIVKQCIYLINMIIVDDLTIDLEFRSQYFDVCQNISEDFELQFLSKSHNLLYNEILSLNYDVHNPIQKLRFKLKDDIKQILKSNPDSQFTVRGQSFYFASMNINYDKETLFLIIQLCYFALYLSIGLISVFVLLKTQNRQE